MYNSLIKTLVIGNSKAGKTALIAQYCNETFNPEHEITIGVDFSAKIINFVNLSNDKRSSKLQIWDTAGQESFKSTTISYYRGALLCLIVVDANQPTTNKIAEIESSLEDLLGRTDETRKIILVESKIDLLKDKPEFHVLTDDELSEINKEFFCHVAVSAKTKENMQLFRAVVIGAVETILYEKMQIEKRQTINEILSKSLFNAMINKYNTNNTSPENTTPIPSVSTPIPAVQGNNNDTILENTTPIPPVSTAIPAVNNARKPYNNFAFLFKWFQTQSMEVPSKTKFNYLEIKSRINDLNEDQIRAILRDIKDFLIKGNQERYNIDRPYMIAVKGQTYTDGLVTVDVSEHVKNMLDKIDQYQLQINVHNADLQSFYLDIQYAASSSSILRYTSTQAFYDTHLPEYFEKLVMTYTSTQQNTP